MPYARLTDPQTSHDAARSVSNMTLTQKAILAVLRFGGLTDTDLVRFYNDLHHNSPELAPRASESGIRSRRAELVALGLVRDSGRLVKLASGRNATVWELVA